ncbi:hypothetical protein ALT_4669 [Aspergillus lentulus]|uniref:Uncharacterized protein n=1 Tax=Aspergillus lentulus TaxID=293939 RepID=A0AAN6BLK7_ASPLE|nr:hypothetical protein CNMCM6069_009036 [Aspergillus lentulus]KAF4167718.1 hypothetical protein CNMCM6936_004563 [Aspergillus lentulus]KAF4195035.1 hypothetical protein CNMCM8694_006929 [Aspergillus lentulus]KAF4201761.1 hypothetical protein CNMCM8927_001090 [Aspergillus lentulus]GAQ07348.1 hypothetical protein ALT_4669 [Aspergillus lentulus]
MAPKPKPKPKPKPPKQSSHPTPTRQENEPPCEFTHPCTTSTHSSNTSGSANASGKGSHPRKLISHIFGRNKTSTKLFPSSVWVHYCRKHYQRARYRSRAWPFTQCELLLDSLARMEAWGGVESFEVVLRRREVQRLSSSFAEQQASDKEGVRVRKGRRGGASASASACASEGEEEHADDEEESGDGKKRQRRKPRIKACPVPEWLRAETGPGKTFAEIRAIVERIREDLTEQHRQAQKTKTKNKEQVLFPDIEILPTFQEWVLEQANEDGENRREMSRVSRKGAVQKVQR